MSYWVYILYSKSSQRYYCGSSEVVARRLRQHNDPNCTGSKTTKRFSGPWELLYTEPFETRAEAMRRERCVKKRGIERYLMGHAPLAESRQTRD